MLELPRVTLVCLTGKDIIPHLKAIQLSTEGVHFGDVKMIYQPTIKSIDEWNHHIIYDLHNYIDTDFALLIHADGYVVNPRCWRDDFLEYDFIGAPWPLPQDNYSYLTPKGELVRVGNSVSLRSKRLLEAPSRLDLEWKSYYGNTNEDGFLCCHNRDILKENGCTFAPLEVARYFSKEHTIEENKDIKKTFCFHSIDA